MSRPLEDVKILDLTRLLPGGFCTLLLADLGADVLKVEDTSGGAHDTLIAPCDAPRYRLLGVEGHHDNCRDNLHAALAILGITAPATPSPLNLFMNIPWTADGRLAWGEPVSTPGSYVMFRAEMELVVAFSACPQDILPINGRTGQTTEAHFSIE